MFQERLPAATMGEFVFGLLDAGLCFAKCLLLVRDSRALSVAVRVFSRCELDFRSSQIFLPYFDLALPESTLFDQPIGYAANLQVDGAERVLHSLAEFAER